MSERRNLVRANGTRVSQNGGKADSSRFGNTPDKQRRTGAGKHLKNQKYSAPAENTDKVVAKGRSLYGKPDANGNDSDSEDEDGGSGHHEELLAGDASVDRGYISDADQYGVQRRHETEHPEDEALDGMDHRSLPGTRGKMSEEERIDLPRKLKLYKRDIVRENLMGRWEDAQFYATPDEMVVQFVEAAYPDALDGILLEQEKEKEKLEQEKMQEASRFFGNSIYKQLRVEFRESINSFRAEKSSGTTGLKRTARSEWQLDRLRKVEGVDAHDKRLAELLADGAYHRGARNTPLANPEFLSIIKSCYGTTEITMELLTWSMVVLEEFFQNRRMDNDHSNNQDKMLMIGLPLKAQIVTLTKAQKAIPRLIPLVRCNTTLAAYVRQKHELTVTRKRKRNERLDFSEMDISAAEAEAMKLEPDDETGADAAEDLEGADGGKEDLALGNVGAVPEEAGRLDEEPTGPGSAKVGSRHESQFDSGVLPSAGTDDFGRNSRAPTPEPQPPGLDPLEVNSPVPKGSAGLEGLPAEPQRSTESTGGAASLFTAEEEKILKPIAAFKKSLDKRCLEHNTKIVTRAMAKGLVSPEGWVADEVINVYLALLKEREALANDHLDMNLPRCLFLDTFFYERLHETNRRYDFNRMEKSGVHPKEHFMDFDKLIIPIHMPKHWALAVMDVKKQTVEYLDPAQREGVYFYAPNKDFAKTVLDDLCEMFHEDCLRKSSKAAKSEATRRRPKPPSTWKKVLRFDIALQTDAVSCGPFLMKFAECISKSTGKGKLDDFTQDDLLDYRKRAMLDLVYKKVKL